MAARGTIRISTPTNSRNTRAGFTLLEVMIVVAIIAGLVAIALPRFGTSSTKLRAAIRKLSTMSRQLHSMAKLEQVTYRLVIDMGKGPEGTQTYWVEKASRPVLLDDSGKNSMEEYSEKKDDSKDGDAPKSDFAPDGRITKKPVDLPSGMVFESVELASAKQAVASGRIYIHFFPGGLVDEAAIHLKAGEKSKWTLAIHPLTGKTDVFTDFYSLEDVRAK